MGKGLLSGARYPANPDQLAAYAADQGAPDVAVRALGDMPGRAYEGLPDVMEALGHGHETRRF